MPDMLVLDCSVAAKWVLPEPDRAMALRLFDQYESGEVDLLAPDLLLQNSLASWQSGVSENRFPRSKLKKHSNFPESSRMRHVYTAAEPCQDLARKYTAGEWQKSELFAARDAPEGTAYRSCGSITPNRNLTACVGNAGPVAKSPSNQRSAAVPLKLHRSLKRRPGARLISIHIGSDSTERSTQEGIT